MCQLVNTLTKSVSIRRVPEDVYRFLKDPMNWPKWAINSISEVRPTNDPDWFNMTTFQGEGRLRVCANDDFFLLDHDFHTVEASWSVPARVVANGDGSEFMMTFFQPNTLDSEQFAQQASRMVEGELLTLKEILETA
jgi:hypothetical protein